MELLNPAALWISLLAIPILILYMLKLRRREVVISSTLLWQMLLRDRQVNSPWQRLKRNLLLILQLAILASLVLALTRPAIRIQTVASGSLVVLLDASASMAAADAAPTRFDTGKKIIRDLIDNLSPSAALTLILASNPPQVLASRETSQAVLRQVLAEADCTNGPADWEAAFTLVAGAAADSRSSEEFTTVIISDGGLPQTGLPNLPGKVVFYPVGTSDDNLAISALSLRSSAQGTELFVRASNYSATNREVILSIYKENPEGQSVLSSAQRLHLPAGQETSLSLTGMAAEQALYRVVLSDPAFDTRSLDSLPLDDQAYAVFQPPATGRVLLLTPGNFFLEQVLSAQPGITTYRALPLESGEVSIPDEAFDLYVFDGLAPEMESLPPGNLLIINPPVNPLFEVTGLYTSTALLVLADSSLLKFVDWMDVHISQARQVSLPIWAESIIQAEGGALFFAGETGGRRVAVLTFDLHNSDLPLQIAFPILFNNLVTYLVPANVLQVPQELHPGESLSILPASDVTEIVISAPSGKEYRLQPGEAGTYFDQNHEIGFYQVGFLGMTSLETSYYSVNLFDPSESNITPQDSLRLGRSNFPASIPHQISQREIWPWLAAVALLILLVEWAIYHGRQRLPSLNLVRFFSSLRINGNR